MFTENFHLEQERTKFSYQDRTKTNCPLSSILPQVGAGLQHDNLGSGAGSILAWGYRVITVKRQLTLPSHNLGSP